MYSNRRYNFVIDHRKYDLVAISIAVKGEKFGCFGTSHSLLESDKYEKKLKARLRSVLGEIGKCSIRTNSTNIIGKCAEVKAANNILKLEKKLEI